MTSELLREVLQDHFYSLDIYELYPEKLCLSTGCRQNRKQFSLSLHLSFRASVEIRDVVL